MSVFSSPSEVILFRIPDKSGPAGRQTKGFNTKGLVFTRTKYVIGEREFVKLHSFLSDCTRTHPSLPPAYPRKLISTNRPRHYGGKDLFPTLYRIKLCVALDSPRRLYTSSVVWT